MRIIHKQIEVQKYPKDKSLQFHFGEIIQSKFLDESLTPLRFAVTNSINYENYICEVSAIENYAPYFSWPHINIFRFRKRLFDNAEKFNVALAIPTGLGCSIGGHAGDATPAARLLASVCDTLITHPNVVNASDINEMTDNTLYVEGSVLSRLLMGTIGLEKVRSNKVLALVEKNEFSEYSVNAINAARSTLGIDCDLKFFDLGDFKMITHYAKSGSAVGEIEGIDTFLSMLMKLDHYDAFAITTKIESPIGTNKKYFYDDYGVNPWGGVEAMLTHAVSTAINKPTAHSPMLESKEVENEDYGIVAPRKAAEVMSKAFLHCILKGLHKAPRIVTDASLFNSNNVLSAKDISCLVIPDQCLGLPTLAAMEQGIPIIAVKKNNNIMRNDLHDFHKYMRKGQLIYVGNYLEAAGVISALKNGISPESTKRNIPNITEIK